MSFHLDFSATCFYIGFGEQWQVLGYNSNVLPSLTGGNFLRLSGEKLEL
jgi:hypothetical protein